MSDPGSAPDMSFLVRLQTPIRQMGRRSSLEHVLSFTLTSPAAKDNQILEATFIFTQILDSCRNAGAILLESSTMGGGNLGFANMNQAVPTRSDGPIHVNVYLHKLFGSLYEHSPTDSGRANLVRMILHGLFNPEKLTPEFRSLESILPLARRWVSFTPAECRQIYVTLADIGRDLLTGFFLPLMAQGGNKGPVLTFMTPIAAVNISSDQGTLDRLGGLRNLVLRRDGYRCVVTGIYDKDFIVCEMEACRTPPMEYGLPTQAAHIIPHSLNAVRVAGDTLDSTKSFVWGILNMFDPGIANRLAGTNIDISDNALLLTSDIHDEFGKLRCYFEEVEGLPDTYVFKTARRSSLPPFHQPQAPTLTFTNHEPVGEQQAALPDRRFLRLHAACCVMLSMSGAAGYVERLLHDAEELLCRGTLASDGSSAVDIMLKLHGLREEGGIFEEEREWVNDEKSLTKGVVVRS